MKRIKIVMASAIVLAIGSALATKASATAPDNATFVQSANACTALATDCNATGTRMCLTANIYQIKSSSLTCSVPLTQKN